MNNTIFKKFQNTRPFLNTLVNYYNIRTKQSKVLYLVRNIDEFNNTKSKNRISEILQLDNDVLNEKEIELKGLIKDYSGISNIYIIKDSIITHESTLSDVKNIICYYLNENLKQKYIPDQLFIEESTTRKPMENYLSDISLLETNIDNFKIEEKKYEIVQINDILLNNVFIDENDVLKVNIYNISDYIDSIKSTRDELIREKLVKNKLINTLRNYWINLENEDIKFRIENNSFADELITQDLDELIRQFKDIYEPQGNYNQLFWKGKINEHLFKNLGIYFNSFILENTENVKNRKIDIYSVFKYFELDSNVPFSRYSYGGQVSQKIVKIYENFYSIDNIKYLERWNSLINYRDTPANCVQWKGFYNYHDDTLDETNLLNYEILLFSDGLYQIRLYQQKMNLEHVETFLEYIRVNILDKIKKILYNIGIELILNPLQLGNNIHFTFSKLQIDVALINDIELGKLQNILNKSIYLFSKVGDLVSNEFINLEFKKVDNHTRSDQIIKYINHYVVLNRCQDYSEFSNLAKQIVAKFNKTQDEAKEIVKNWTATYVNLENQKSNKIKISRNIGLELIGKQIGSNSCSFYMTNITSLKDIYTFFYYLIVLVNISQLKENSNIYAQIVGLRNNEKALIRNEEKKTEEQKVLSENIASNLDDMDMEFIDIADDVYYGEDPVDETLSVHKETPEEELIAVEKETAAGPSEELPQEDIIDELEPILNGSSYYIKRLQLMDKEVYDYKADSKFKQYSKKAMPNDSRQPIIVTNRQMEKIKAKYPTDTNVFGGIRKDIDVYSKDYKTPSYSIKYRNLHYICPKVWCMLDQMPYYMDQLLETGSPSGFATVGHNEKGEFLVNPGKVKCPDCGHGVWGVAKEGTLLISQDNLKRQPYPGFFTADQHPKNMCMVACFKTPNKKIEECIGSEKPIKKEKKISNERYILKGDKYGICNNGRFCILPDKLHNWINADFGNYKLERTIIDEYTSYLRRGILKEDEEYYQSFEKSIQYLLGDSIFKLSSYDFRQYLINRLKGIPDINKIFRKVRKGSLYLIFGKDIEKYYRYIEQTISLQPRFLIPILSYPSVLTENGINFYIIKEEKDRIYLECEYFNYEFINLNEKADNMFIYTHSLGETYKKVYFEPIVLVQQKSKSLQIVRSINGSNRIVIDLFKYLKSECTEKEDPWITDIRRSGLTQSGITEDEYFINKQSSESILNSIEETGEFQIIQQYVNDYNQTEGLIIKWLAKDTKFYLPISPIEIIDNIRINKYKKLIQLHTLNDTREFLDNISNKTNIFYTPYFYTLNSEGLISGIYTITGNWIPVLYSDVSSSNIEELNEWKYPKDIWFEQKILSDDRLVNKRQRDTKKLNYEKLRFELSKFIRDNDEYKQQILDYMKRYKVNQNLEQRNKLRIELIELLSNLIRQNIVIPGPIGEWNIKDIFTYCSNNKTLLECNNSSMCKFNEETNQCKVLINPEWYWKYISRIADELLVNINKRKEIVEEYRKELEIPEDERIFYSKDELDDYLEKYDFNLENKKYISHPMEHFSYTNPNRHLSEEIIQHRISEKLYNIPRYILNYFGSNIQFTRDIGIYNSKEINSNYFFNNITYLIKDFKKKSIPTRFELANRIRNEKNAIILLNRYKALSDRDNQNIYRKFKAIKSIEALADYIKESSWGSIIDLELFAEIYQSLKLRFIIMEDDGNANRKKIFIHLPNHLKEMNERNINEYNFAIFILNKNRFELVIKKTQNSAIFKADELAFIDLWLTEQIEFEKRMPY